MNAVHLFSALLLPLATIHPWLALKNLKLWGGELDSSVSGVNLIHNCSMALTMYSIHGTWKYDECGTWSMWYWMLLLDCVFTFSYCSIDTDRCTHDQYQMSPIPYTITHPTYPQCHTHTHTYIYITHSHLFSIISKDTIYVYHSTVFALRPCNAGPFLQIYVYIMQ